MTVNSARYVVMIQSFLIPELCRRRLNQFRIWFQQDRATAHTSREAMAIPQRKSVRRQATRYSSVAESNWEGNARHTSPSVWAGDDQLLSEAERVRPKQGLSFKRRYFSCVTIFFFKYSYGILKLQHFLYLLKKLKTFFHENWLCTTSFKTIRFHWRTLYKYVAKLQCIEVYRALPVTKGTNFKSGKLNKQNAQSLRKSVY